MQRKQFEVRPVHAQQMATSGAVPQHTFSAKAAAYVLGESDVFFEMYVACVQYLHRSNLHAQSCSPRTGFSLDH